ncbi:MAG: hypothetical protein JNM56_37670 [Planctomycetia bacterium]|nr:hypothetical protein [Planctomycetia bacterium]
MATKIIPLHELQMDTEGYLRRCLDSGQALVVELPDHRLLSIQPVEEDDALTDELIEHNAAFQALLAKSAASPRKPFRSIVTPASPGLEEPQGNPPR